MVVTVRNTVHRIDGDGRVAWTYASPENIQSVQALPSGRVHLLTAERHETLQVLRGGVKEWEFTSEGWIREFGPVDSTGALYLVTFGGNPPKFPWHRRGGQTDVVNGLGRRKHDDGVTAA